MPSNNSKYATEMREQTAAYIIENHKSTTSMAKEKGQTRKPPQSAPELKYRVKELEKAFKDKNLELAQRERRLAEEKETVEILKKSLHIFMQVQE